MIGEVAGPHSRIHAEDYAAIERLTAEAVAEGSEDATAHGPPMIDIANRETRMGAIAMSRVVAAADMIEDVTMTVAETGDASAAHLHLCRPHPAHPLADAATREAASATPGRGQGRTAETGILEKGETNMAGRADHVLSPPTDVLLHRSGGDILRLVADRESGAGDIRAHHIHREDTRALEAGAGAGAVVVGAGVAVTRRPKTLTGLRRPNGTGDVVSVLHPTTPTMNIRGLGPGAGIQLVKAVGESAPQPQPHHHLHPLVANMLMFRKMTAPRRPQVGPEG